MYKPNRIPHDGAGQAGKGTNLNRTQSKLLLIDILHIRTVNTHQPVRSDQASKKGSREVQEAVWCGLQESGSLMPSSDSNQTPGYLYAHTCRRVPTILAWRYGHAHLRGHRVSPVALLHRAVDLG